MIGVDWMAVAVLLVAYAFSRVSHASLATKNWVFAIALFAIAGWRLRSGAHGMNLAIVAGAVILGITYVVQALRAPK